MSSAIHWAACHSCQSQRTGASPYAARTWLMSQASANALWAIELAVGTWMSPAHPLDAEAALVSPRNAQPTATAAESLRTPISSGLSSPRVVEPVRRGYPR